ncbi:MFS transporter [Labedaea rhizosphaerae]|nr:MFS transporter [Labedaea rhizosphaerae]
MERGRGALALASGVVVLEFAAAVATFVFATLLPAVAAELRAQAHLGLLLAGATLGLFTALPLASRVLHRLGPGRTLALGVLGYLGGLALAATARSPLVFGAGEFLNGFAGGLLAVYGMSAVIDHLDDALRAKVVAASSAMWILPALVAPPVTLLLQHAVGWRWTLLLPLPFVLAGRLLVVRAVPGETRSPGRPLGRTLLIPVGVATLVLSPWWPAMLGGAVVATVGVVAILPEGTARLRRGAPASLAALALFGAGYFGAHAMVTVLLTDGYHASIGQAAAVLSAGSLAWGLSTLVISRLRWAPPAWAGLAITTAATLTLAVTSSFPVAVVVWTLGGMGIGLAYPRVYLSATTDSSIPATELATAAITAEGFGALFGRAAGGAVVSLAVGAGLAVPHALTIAYVVFGITLAGATVVAGRT